MSIEGPDWREEMKKLDWPQWMEGRLKHGAFKDQDSRETNGRLYIIVRIIIVLYLYNYDVALLYGFQS